MVLGIIPNTKFVYSLKYPAADTAGYCTVLIYARRTSKCAHRRYLYS